MYLVKLARFLTWPHHRLTALLYFDMRACKCSLFTAEGSRRLPKRLNYCYSFEISTHLMDEFISHSDYSLEAVWTFEYVSRTIDTRNSVYKITYTVILNKYQHEHLQNYKLHWLCMHIHTSGNSVVSPVCLVCLPLTTLVSEYLLNSYLLNVSNVLARTSSDLEDWMSTRESSQCLELCPIM